MKKILGSALSALTLLTAAQAAGTSPASGLPLSSHVLLYDAQGVNVGRVDAFGLVFTGRSAADVVLARVMPATPQALGSGAGTFLHTLPGRTHLEMFGAAGQRMDLALPGLKRMEWWSKEGRISTLPIR